MRISPNKEYLQETLNVWCIWLLQICIKSKNFSSSAGNNAGKATAWYEWASCLFKIRCMCLYVSTSCVYLRVALVSLKLFWLTIYTSESSSFFNNSTHCSLGTQKPIFCIYSTAKEIVLSARCKNLEFSANSHVTILASQLYSSVIIEIWQYYSALYLLIFKSDLLIIYQQLKTN